MQQCAGGEIYRKTDERLDVEVGGRRVSRCELLTVEGSPQRRRADLVDDLRKGEEVPLSDVQC